MGGASSKAARKYPKRPEAPHWAGARTPTATDSYLPGRPQPRASETRTEEIEKDAKDPQLMQNLSRIGVVRVDHHMQSVRLAKDVNKLFQSRAQSESQAAAPRPTQNRLHVQNLTELLDERKSATSPADIVRLASKYGIDVDKLESVTRFVTSPSVTQASTTTNVETETGDMEVIMEARWIEPQIRDSSHARSQ